MECPNCKKLIPEEAQICPFCLFVIKDWREGKTMVNEHGEVIPPYVSDSRIFTQKSEEERNFKSLASKKLNEPEQTLNSANLNKFYLDTAEYQSDPNKDEKFKNDNNYIQSQVQVENFQESEPSPKYDANSKNIKENLKDKNLFNQESRFSNQQSNNGGVDEITNVNFEEEPKNSTFPKKKKVAGIIVAFCIILIVILTAVLVIQFWFHSSLAGETVKKDDFSDIKVSFLNSSKKKSALSSPKQLTIKLSGNYKNPIPVKNLEVLANGKPVVFETDEKTVTLNDQQTKLTGEVKGLKKFSNKFSLRVISDQKKILFRSSSTNVTFPFDLMGTYWQVKYKNDINSPEKTMSIYFQSNKRYEETLATAPVNYADTKKIKKWNVSQVHGTFVQGESADGSIRYLTNPQAFIENQYFSNFNGGKEPITRIKYQNGQIPDDLNDYRHEVRLKNNQLYFFLPSDNPQIQTQIFLFKEIQPQKFTSFEKADSFPEIKQPGLTEKKEIAADIRRRILQNFQSQLSYDLPDNNQAHLNTVFYDSPNGLETTGLITYYSEGKDNNLMKFILYRNGRINVYPLNSGFDVPKAYTINIYRDLKNDDYKKFPDFKK